jgi:hypothetical protein
MFAVIAPSYDLNNRLHSLWMDQLCRRWTAMPAALRLHFRALSASRFDELNAGTSTSSPHARDAVTMSHIKNRRTLTGSRDDAEGSSFGVMSVSRRRGPKSAGRCPI